MEQIPRELVEKAVDVLGACDLSEEKCREEMLLLAGETMLATRLIDWIPEAFGYVVLGQIKNVRLLDEFLARTADNKWVWIPFDAEPIFAHAVSIGKIMSQGESSETRKRIADRSSYLSSLQKALDAGNNVEGSVISGPTFFGIPAETYSWKKKSFWKRLWGG